MKNNDIDSLTIADKILMGAMKCSDGDPNKSFMFEELVLASWKLDKNRFGLRGFEEDHPDSHKLHAHVFGGTALVAKGFLRVEQNGLLHLTEAGLARSLSLSHTNIETSPRVSKALQYGISKLLENKFFKEWLQDSSHPKEFRSAAYFWGISFGTPPKIVREKLSQIEQMLKEILKFFETTKLDCIKEERVNGKILFEKRDVERCLEFHNQLKIRFQKELRRLDPEGKY
ncbi:MAG: hypothetical protein QXX20_04585 [Candidatus Thermoplasmatota archaeon]